MKLFYSFDTWGHSPEDQYNTNVSASIQAVENM